MEIQNHDENRIIVMKINQLFYDNVSSLTTILTLLDLGSFWDVVGGIYSLSGFGLAQKLVLTFLCGGKVGWVISN